MTFPVLPALCAALLLGCQPAVAQLTVLDQAQDEAGRPAAASPAAAAAEETAAEAAAPAPPCGTAPLSIARMSWSSAALLSEIHARVLHEAFGCTVSVIPGDLAATASSMGSTGQPAVAPEMWVTRIADVWNGAIEGQMVRSAAPAYGDTSFEGWYLPAYMADANGARPAAAGLAALLAEAAPEGRVRFISCPIDWACSLINRNLVAAYGLEGQLEIVEPANRFEMDSLIGEAVNRREPFVFYYWQPNAILAQLDFVALDMGAYDETAAKCLAERACANPQVSAFPPEIVVTALADRVFAEMPLIAGYFQRATLDLAVMDGLLARLNEPGASVESVADGFVAEQAAIWQRWVGSGP